MGAKIAVVSKDPTSAERSRRYRQRRKLQQAGVTPAVTAPVEAASITPSRHGIVPLLMACAALAVAAVSSAFSIVGMTAIFAGSFWPVIGMGAALESAKLSAVAWLGRGYCASRWLKGAIVTLVLALMGLNVIGAYGYLSRAHIDREIAGEAKVADHQAQIEARKQLAAANVADIDRRIGQIDSAIAEATKRGRTASAMALAERQAGRRDQLVAERTRAARALAAVEVENAGLENERSEITVDFGPVEYLSKLLGIERDTVMRWFIVLVACLLDPAALMLLLAASRDSVFLPDEPSPSQRVAPAVRPRRQTRNRPKDLRRVGAVAP
jgi:hypothetical protein